MKPLLRTSFIALFMALFIALFSALLFGAQSINAQSPYVQNDGAKALAEQKLVEQLARLTTYQASFKQIVAEDDGYILDENSGVMSLERPSKLYWKVLEPFPNLLVSDGEKVYFYDPDLDQVRVRNWSSNPSENPVAVFIGEMAISDYYNIEEADEVYTLQPKKTESGFSDIKIEFSHDAIKSMSVVDSLGQITTITFSAAEDRIKEIPENPYMFTIPATAEVIDDS